jgi:hypothetical protein
MTTGAGSKSTQMPKIGHCCGGAKVWMWIQGAYATWHAERDLASEIPKIPRLTGATV